MNNVTMVIPTEREVNYHIFMYTMYQSSAPSLRQLASFMRTDLEFKQLEVRGFASHWVRSIFSDCGSIDGVLGCSSTHCMVQLAGTRTIPPGRLSLRRACELWLPIGLSLRGLSFLLQFGVGPGNDTMTIKRLLSRSWQFKNVITTAQTFVAPKMPPPPRPFVLAKSGPAPLVSAIKDCSTFKVGTVTASAAVLLTAVDCC
jgi:hypothetical protein